MARPSTPANTTIGVYVPLNTSNSGPKGISRNSNSNTITVGADFALWDSAGGVFVSPEATNVGAND